MKAQRNTVQRQLVLDALLKLNNHSTIDEIFAQIHDNHPSISKTTVYRNLRLLSDNGAIRQVFLPDGLERYETRGEQHYHFKCRDCGFITDIDIDHPVDINRFVQETSGMQIDGHDFVFYGICPQCGGIRK